jgi:4-diphosphocytidyl-2-C-methyl-D-erythritol kinase
MVPHEVGTGWEILAPAKVNLFLDVVGQRPDGFHDLETLMVPVRLFDQIRWIPTESTEGDFDLRICDCRPYDVVGSTTCDQEQNLVSRAARALAARAGILPYGVFELTKRIPEKAGLGGGSSDAAATLLLANRAWRLDYPQEILHELATELGSDVPFFLTGQAAVCRGRGERITRVENFPRLELVVAKPPVGLSTASVFAEFDLGDRSENGRNRGNRMVEHVRRSGVWDAGRWMHNSLEAAAARLSPWIDKLRRAFVSLGCSGQVMTGSGSAYVGVMRTAARARRTARLLTRMNLESVFVTSTW